MTEKKSAFLTLATLSPRGLERERYTAADRVGRAGCSVGAKCVAPSPAPPEPAPQRGSPAAGGGKRDRDGRPADRPAPSTAAVSLSAVIGRRGRAEAPSTIPQRAARSATAARPTAPLYSALKIARRAPPRGSWGGGGSRVAGQSAPPPAVRHHPPRPERRCHWAAVISGAPRTRPSRPAVYPTWSRAA